MFSFINKLPKPFLIGSTLATGFGIACLLKEMTGGQQYRTDILITDKVVIITGANSGIGQATAMELAKRGGKIYMACRDMTKCEETRKEIVMESKNKYVYCRPCDLASLESVHTFVKQFKSEQNRLDILINNAGVMKIPKKLMTKDGFEMQLGVNHLGHFLLTNLLLDYLKTSLPSRIINISSVAHKRGKINKEDFNSDKNYDPSEAYAQSKLANVLFTQELAERLKDTGVTVNAVHPGIVDTPIIRHMSFYNSWIAAIFIKPFIWPFVKSPRQGAFTTVYVAVKPELEKVTGKYFSNCEEEPVGIIAKDETTKKWLWKVSEKWTRLNEIYS